MRDDYVAEASDEHVTKLNNVLYITIALVITQNQQISLENKRSLEQSSRLQKNTQSLRFFWYRNIRDI